MSIFRRIKRVLYFWVAGYFAFWAGFVLRRWKPTVITVTGSSGKTTLLHLFEAQLGDKAIYSHKANSAFGIPFHILGIERKTFSFGEWPHMLLLAPLMAFRKVPTQTIYVTEADAERPGEGQLLAKLLKPHILVWLSLEEAHGVNYDRLVKKGASDSETRDRVKKVIAEEFAAFIESTQSLLILQKENPFIVAESKRHNAPISWISESDVHMFEPQHDGVMFKTAHGEFRLPHLVPYDVGQSILAVEKALEFLHIKSDRHFAHFKLPPGRSSVFRGVHETNLIDSTYNATFDGMRTMLDLFERYPASGEKWLVLGDMIEEGQSEAYEHILLVDLIKKTKADRVVLVGPRLLVNTFPKLIPSYGKNVVSFTMPREALEYLERELKGGETILFKGARFLEGIVENLLINPFDATKLCRREEVWVRRRKQWGI